MLKRKGTVRQSLFFDNLILFFIPYLILLLVLFLLYGRAAEEKTAQTFEIRFEKMCSLLNTQLEDIPRLCNQLNQSDWMKALFLYENDEIFGRGGRMGLLSTAGDTLKGYMGTNDLIGSAAVYFPKSRTILTDNAAFLDWNTLCPLKPDSIPEDVWLKEMEEPHTQELSSVSGVTLSGKEQNGLLYLQSLPYFGSVPRATIAIFVPENRLEKGILSQIELADGMEMELYLHGTCMLQTGTPGEEPLPDRYARLATARFWEKGDRVFRSESFSNGMECYFFVPRSALKAPAGAEGIVLLTVGAILLLSGISISNFMAHRQYNPLAELVEQAEQLRDFFPASVPSGAGSNEYQKIEGLLKEGITLFSSTQHRMEELREQLWRWRLSNYLTGEGRNETAENLELLFPYSFLGCLILEAWNEEGIPLWPKEENGPQAAAIRLIGTQFPSFAVSFASHQDLQNALSLVEKALPNGAHAGYAGSGKGLLSLPQAFRQAEEAMKDARFLEQPFCIFPGEETGAVPASLLSFDAIQMLRSGNADEAYVLMAKAAAQAPLHASIRVRLLRQVMQELSGLCREELRKTPGSETYRAYLQLLKENCREAARVMVAQRDGEKERMKARILDYVEEHAGDSALSLSSAADAFGYTPAYFSSLFKSLTGENFLEFVNTTRVRRAKQLLRETDLSVKEIAAAAGFPSDITFRRIFKKAEQISASDYRIGARKEKQD